MRTVLSTQNCRKNEHIIRNLFVIAVGKIVNYFEKSFRRSMYTYKQVVAMYDMCQKF